MGMCLSLQIGFSFVESAVGCAILERTSGLEPSSETTALRYMKLVQYPDSSLNLPQDAIDTICHQSGLFSTDLPPSYTLCWFYQDSQLGFLIPALPPLEHLCHRQTPDW